MYVSVRPHWPRSRPKRQAVVSKATAAALGEGSIDWKLASRQHDNYVVALSKIVDSVEVRGFIRLGRRMIFGCLIGCFLPSRSRFQQAVWAVCVTTHLRSAEAAEAAEVADQQQQQQPQHQQQQRQQQRRELCCPRVLSRWPVSFGYTDQTRIKKKGTTVF